MKPKNNKYVVCAVFTKDKPNAINIQLIQRTYVAKSEAEAIGIFVVECSAVVPEHSLFVKPLATKV